MMVAASASRWPLMFLLRALAAPIAPYADGRKRRVWRQQVGILGLPATASHRRDCPREGRLHRLAATAAIDLLITANGGHFRSG